ncbi:hypothetical protein D3C81_1017530 [compost metagenome]
MAGDDGEQRHVPHHLGVDDAKADEVQLRAEQVPAEAQRVRRQRYQVLARHRQKGEVVGEMVGDGDRHQGQHEVAGHAQQWQGRLAVAGAAAGDQRAKQQEHQQEQGRHQQQGGRGDPCQRARRRGEDGVDDVVPRLRFHHAVETDGGQHQDHQHQAGGTHGFHRQQARRVRTHVAGAVAECHGREAGQQAEDYAEHFRIAQPGGAAEQRHARPRAG